MMQKQVDRSHYNFSKYIHKRRWASMWYQFDEVLALKPGTVLEIGPGPGVFKALAELWDIKVETLDIDQDLRPDHVAPADAMPFEDDSYDMVCAFQMLEHVPYETALAIFGEMSRVAKKHIIISLPDARPALPFSFHMPLIGDVRFFISIPWPIPQKHIFNGEHYWEINKKGYPLSKVAKDLTEAGTVTVERTYRVKEYPYHRYFIFKS